MEFAELRKKADFKTQKSLADVIESKQSTVAMWESKKRIPKGKTLILLAKVLKCSTDDILNCFK